MREQLKNLTENDYWVYGVTESDFDHAVSIVREMIEARNHQYESEVARVRSESSEIADDILMTLLTIVIPIISIFGSLLSGGFRD
ncbi:TPA: hypothetical protein NKQ32_004534 [Vibrio parahaemolyticus]|nr:hypothetical protein [Vibrio parahaemolyticus]